MNVVITRKIPQICIDKLINSGFEVQSNQADETLSKEELIKRLANADAAVTSLVDIIDEEVIATSKNVKIYANFAVGFNNIDMEAARKNGVTITNTPDVLSDTTAETAIALMFAVARRSVEADSYVRSGKWKSFRADLMLGRDIFGKTLGLIGAGRIGRKVAAKMKGFDMRIVYHNRKRDPELERETGAVYEDMDTVLKTADYVSLHTPLTPRTDKMIGEDQIGMMKKNAVLINTSRGAVVDEEALAKALKEKRIFGAGLDVFENEPFVNEQLLSLDNVVMFPHIGSASIETRNKMAELCADNILQYFKNGNVLTPVCI